MAIGDAIAVLLGTAETSLQPASGVEAQISSITANGNTDAPKLYDGTNNSQIIDGSVNTQTASAVGTTGSPRNVYNMAIMITNSLWLLKAGTTDRLSVGGVYTNA